VRRLAVLAPDAPDYPLENTGNAVKLLGIVANSLLRRPLHAKAANAIVNVVNCALRAIELEPMQERIDKIEVEMKALGTKLTRQGVMKMQALKRIERVEANLKKSKETVEQLAQRRRLRMMETISWFTPCAMCSLG